MQKNYWKIKNAINNTDPSWNFVKYLLRHILKRSYPAQFSLDYNINIK